MVYENTSVIGLKSSLKELTPTQISNIFSVMSNQIDKLYAKAIKISKRLGELGAYPRGLVKFEKFTWRPSPEEVENMSLHDLEMRYELMEDEIITLKEIIDIGEQIIRLYE